VSHTNAVPGFPDQAELVRRKAARQEEFDLLCDWLVWQMWLVSHKESPVRKCQQQDAAALLSSIDGAGGATLSNWFNRELRSRPQPSSLVALLAFLGVDLRTASEQSIRWASTVMYRKYQRGEPGLPKLRGLSASLQEGIDLALQDPALRVPEEVRERARFDEELNGERTAPEWLLFLRSAEQVHARLRHGYDRDERIRYLAETMDLGPLVVMIDSAQAEDE
jgi:hypothetical protein